MMSAHARRVMSSLPAALLTLLATALLGAGSASAAPGGPATATGVPPAQVPAGTVHARITGAPILGTNNQNITQAEAAPTPIPGKAGQIARLKAALAYMTANYPSLANYTPGPQDIFDYGIGNLWDNGIDGAGTTIALLEGWNDPNIAKVVASYDKQLDLPNPTISTIYPAGPLPSSCPVGMKKLGSYGSCAAWEGELTLDVITAHMIAPYARILLSVTPADTIINADPAQNVAPPEMMEAVEDIANNHLANVISVSDGTGETTYSYGTPEITAQNPGELAAASAGVPFIGATGDCGVVQNLAVANSQCGNAGTTPSSATWDDSPWTLAVGGSVPNVSSTNGAKLGPDPLWHVAPPYAQYSEGAGFSSVFSRPAYQGNVEPGNSWRSVPDLTMDAQDGTSEAAPMLAGVLSLATQANGGTDVGPIQPALYGTLGPAGANDGIADVVSGNNSADEPDGQVIVPGFTAGPGFDIASGWGTLYAPSFVPSLVAATQSSYGEAAARRSAAQQLSSLETSSISLSPRTVPSGSTTYMSASGFLPEYPVTLSVDDSKVARLTASTLGDVTYMIDPQALHLAPGAHTVTLHSLLITETGHFTSQ
jgi:subtilase family serine protease